MQKIINFIDAIFSSDSGKSSKRFFGAIGFITAIIGIMIYKQEYLNEVLYASCALMGLGIFDKKNK
jgi:hypothetical protein